MSAGVVEWLMAPGCKPGGLRLYEGSNPSPSTIFGFWLRVQSSGLNAEPGTLNQKPGVIGGRSAMVAH